MPVVQTFAAHHTLEGAGFEVKRPLPLSALPSLGPFILLDHIGPTEVAPGKAVGAPTHPHAGIETLSYFLEGSGLHYDSLGNRAITGPGEAQWMRAGRGIIHDEGPDEEMRRHGGRSHMVQLWINMPGDRKGEPPAYQTLARDAIPTVDFAGGARFRLVLGHLPTSRAPLETWGNPLLLHGSLRAGQSSLVTLPPQEELGLFVLTGTVKVDGAAVNADELAILDPTSDLQLAPEKNAEVLVLGGDRVPDQMVRHGPFVANSPAEMHETIRAYQSGAFGTLTK
ncbi:MAG: pirin family protein [Pseudomonadota bacterium]